MPPGISWSLLWIAGCGPDDCEEMQIEVNTVLEEWDDLREEAVDDGVDPDTLDLPYDWDDATVFSWTGGPLAQFAVYIEGKRKRDNEPYWTIECEDSDCISSPIAFGDLPDEANETEPVKPIVRGYEFTVAGSRGFGRQRCVSGETWAFTFIGE